MTTESIRSKESVRRIAFELIRDRSFTFGDFTLASGKKSGYYLDMKPTMFNAGGAHVLARLLLDRIAGIPVDYIGGLEMGAVPLISPVAMLSHERARPVDGFFVRKNVKDHGTKKLIEGGAKLRGKNVVILEDVTTTGGSAMTAVDAVRAAGGNVQLVLSIVDREEGAAKFFSERGISFDSLFRASEFMEERASPAA